MATRKGERVPPRPGLPAVSIPGEIPVPEDTDDEMGSGDKTTSPKKARATKTVTLDMDDLKKLLADQVTEISAVQKDAVKEIVTELKGDMERHKEECREHIQQAVDKVVKVEDTVATLMRRVEDLEKGRGPPIQGQEDSERHRLTLVYGGWSRETPRKTILSQLERAFAHYEIKGLLDASPFTTKPRNSMALQTFTVRPGENMVGTRGRMAAVIAAVSATEF